MSDEKPLGEQPPYDPDYDNFSEDEDVEELRERVKALEAGYADHSRVLAEDDDLTAAVSRLGLSVERISDALEKVEEHSKALLALRSQVATVEETAATKTQVSKDVTAVRNEADVKIGRLRGRLWTVSIIAIMVFGAFVFVSYLYVSDTARNREAFVKVNKDVCEARSRQADVMQDFINIQIERTQSSTLLTPERKTEAIQTYQQLLRAFPDVNCDVLAN